MNTVNAVASVSLLRLYVLRALYLLVVLGLGVQVWPNLFHHQGQWLWMNSVVLCMLTAFSFCCVLGLRYPLLMLPVLIWELLWKTLWLALVALPKYLADDLAEPFANSAFECAFVLLVYLALPWPYVYQQYLKQPAERWRAEPASV